MVTYEITAIVDALFAAAYEEYMIGRHIPDLLATGYFASATFSKSGDRYRIRYEAFSQESLDQYLENDAMRLRSDLEDRFPEGVQHSREFWNVIAVFPPSNANG